MDALLFHERDRFQLLRSFQTTEGFHALFCRIQHLYPNNIEAYEALEVEYERIFGQRRFSEYASFRGLVTTKKSAGV